ncbi:tyrosine-type recombinase/integrase [Halorubrum ezzemoulense]|uniref:Integrase n=1 Tax=Halorubrum ezzemoulense TaxID=337243 RepID=A0A481RHA1_HALEZ|nr:tyrosine-type recombinase/integrase [Halorubrum ezzemoulense]QAY20601.1 hypothetical protein EO776_11550 [Halorubrum ezzemoulense]
MSLPTTDVDHVDGGDIDLDDAPPSAVADPDVWSNRRLFGAYLSHFRQDDNISRHTYQHRRTDIRRFHAWLEGRDEHLSDVTKKRLKRYFKSMNEAGYASTTIKTAYDNISQLFNELQNSFGIDINEINGHGGDPRQLSKRDINTGDGGSRKHEKYVTREEKDRMLENVPEPVVRNKLVIQLLWETGWRRGTLANVKVSNIDRDQQLIETKRVKTQGDKEEWLTRPYSDAVAETLSLYLDLGYRDGNLSSDESDALLLTYRDEMSGDDINTVVKRAAEEAGVQETLDTDVNGQTLHAVTAHSLRHSHAHHLIDQGVPMPKVKESLDHSDISITQTYTEQSEAEIIRTLEDDGTATRDEPL